MALETEIKERGDGPERETPEFAQEEVGAKEGGEEVEGKEVPGEKEEGGIGNYLSPEGVMMLLIAIVIDLSSLIILCFGLDDFFILDVVGIITIGFWIYFRSGTVKMTRGAATRMREKAGKVALKEMSKATKWGKRLKMSKATKWGKRLKWLRPLMIVGEFIPYVGAAPCWTLLVIFELKT